MVCLLPYEPAFEALLLQWIPAFFGYHQSLTGGEGLENGAALLQAEENLQEWQQPPSSLYIILEDKQAAGFIRLYRRGDTVIWIEDIFVEAASRGRGIASAAIQAAEKIAAKTPGCRAVCMDVVPAMKTPCRSITGSATATLAC